MTRSTIPAGSLRAVLLAMLVLLSAAAALAHDNRPAYLQIEEVGPARYTLLWRLPIVTGQRMPVSLQLPEGIRDVTPPSEQEFPDAVIQRRLVAGALSGKRIEFVWLETKRTDVLVRAQMLNGTQITTLVEANSPWIDIAAPSSSWSVFRTFIMHGVNHILSGPDHLLFVLALILIVRSLRMLLLTVTSFTLAHSISLTLATLGVVHVPGPPVEACIALSIMLLATEILRLRAGHRSLTSTYPWAVAFIFGLLHGLGFASGLIDIGLPQSDVPLALFAFNCGVETGQLLFIAGVLGIARLIELLRLPNNLQYGLRTAITYAIGIASAFWFIDRVGSIFS